MLPISNPSVFSLKAVTVFSSNLNKIKEKIPKLETCNKYSQRICTPPPYPPHPQHSAWSQFLKTVQESLSLIGAWIFSTGINQVKMALKNLSLFQIGTKQMLFHSKENLPVLEES